MPILGNQIKLDYGILVTCSESRPKAQFYPFGLQEKIPAFLLPLSRGDREPIVDLQALIHGVYDRAGFDLAIDYIKNPHLTNSQVGKFMQIDSYLMVSELHQGSRSILTV